MAGDVEKQWIDGFKLPTVTIDAAYPSVTAESSKSEWIPVNQEAQYRARLVAASLSLNILGGYHSHPEGTPTLSSDDKDFIRDQKLGDLFLVGDTSCNWIELIVRVKRVNYQNKKAPESLWSTTPGGNKIRGQVKIGTYGFDITLAGYCYFDETEEFLEVPVYLENVSSYEPNGK